VIKEKVSLFDLREPPSALDRWPIDVFGG